MSTFTTAASTFDTACDTFTTALGVFNTAVDVVRTAQVSQTRPDGPSGLSAPGKAILRKMIRSTAFQRMLKEAELEGVIQEYAQGGIAGSANPTTVLATVFNAY